MARGMRGKEPRGKRGSLAVARGHEVQRRITDYWDEVFTPDGLEGHAALDDQSARVVVGEGGSVHTTTE